MLSVIPKRFSRKLLLLLCLITGASAVVASWSTYEIARSHQMRSIQKRLIEVAQFTSEFINAERFERVLKDGKQGDIDYESIKLTLQRYKNESPDIAFIYTMAQTDKEGILQFVVDAQEEKDTNNNGMIDADEKPAQLRDSYNAAEIAPKMLEGFKGPVADNEVTEDQWGLLLSGYAPIYNHSNEVVGIVGVDMSANTLAQVKEAFLWQTIVVIVAVILTAIIISMVITWHFNKPVKAITDGIMRVGKGDFDVKIGVHSNDEFEQMATSFNTMTDQLKDRERIKATLDRYVSKEVSEVLLERGEADVTTSMQRKRVTILFVDLEGFSDVAENYTPEQVADLLSSYQTLMIEEVFRHKGSVDKIMADGLMALFGAPLEIEHQERAAVNAARSIRAALETFSPPKGLPKLRARMGINTGWVCVGNVGSGRMMDYTVVGTEVNIASRLESYNKELGTTILMGKNTYDAVNNEVEVNRYDGVTLKGIQGGQTVYSVN